MIWLAVRSFLSGPARAVGAVLSDPRVLAALAALALLAGAYALGRHDGRAACELVRKDREIAALGAAIADLDARILDARKAAARLAGETGAVRAAAAQARKEIRDVLPPRESDHACDLPAAARGLLNRSSGWAD